MQQEEQITKSFYVEENMANLRDYILYDSIYISSRTGKTNLSLRQ